MTPIQVEYGRVNGHFIVANPDAEENFAREPVTDIAESRRFYKFVSRIQNEYQMWKKGKPVTMLNEDRIAQLNNIGFEFSISGYRKYKEREVPELDWVTRMQQMEAFQSEMGHLKVDP